MFACLARPWGHRYEREQLQRTQMSQAPLGAAESEHGPPYRFKVAVIVASSGATPELALTHRHLRGAIRAPREMSLRTLPAAPIPVPPFSRSPSGKTIHSLMARKALDPRTIVLHGIDLCVPVTLALENDLGPVR